MVETMYSFIKKLLFQLDPEISHHLALMSLQLAYRLRFKTKMATKPSILMGLNFPHRIGLAAGLDKNADYVDALASLGFGFIEVGTVTPKPQMGNPRPRLFRLTQEEAIINRMGFNNKGMDHVAAGLEKTRYRGILGINIGKNRDTPIEKATEDYLTCFRALWKYASYITINISSPNTPGLRDLQQSHWLSELLHALKQEQKMIYESHQKYIPLVVKVSPDLLPQELEDLAHQLLEHQIDGVIATNTSTHREGVEHSSYAKEPGGLSGRPLHLRSTEMIRQLRRLLQDKLPIIASGGVMDVDTTQEKLNAGASLVQLYTGFIYHGPHLIKQLSAL